MTTRRAGEHLIDMKIRGRAVASLFSFDIVQIQAVWRVAQLAGQHFRPEHPLARTALPSSNPTWRAGEAFWKQLLPRRQLFTDGAVG
jgi:hypothetical protein